MMNHDLRPPFAPGVAAAVLVVTMLGCGEGTIDEEDARDYVVGWSPTVEQHLESEAAEAARSEAVEQRLDEAVEQQRRSSEAGPAPFDEMVEEVYQQRDYEPRLVGQEQLTERGEAVLAALEVVEDHHLDAEPYQLEAIDEAIDTWEARRDSVDGFDDLAATDDDADEAVAWLVEQKPSQFELSPDNYDELTDALVDDDRRGERMGRAIEDYQDKRAAIAEAVADLEHLLARGLARYAYEQRHFRIKEIFVHPRHWDYYSDPDVERSGRRPDPDRGAWRGGQVWRKAANIADEIAEANEVEILDDKLREAIAEVVDSDDPHATVDAIAPQQPQYAGLVEEYRRYRDIVDDGGWDEVERNDHLGPGQTHEIVADLKERLQIEGYFPQDESIDDTWDETLTDAIREYQQTHQMHVNGRPNHVFWYSLNISAEDRLQQIGLNLERWRHSNLDPSQSRYGFVNIPDFTIELWEDQKRIMRFATVVGDNEKSLNPMTDEKEHSNRTPTPLAAYIDRVAFNPYWNVPERLRADNILPDVQASLERKYALRLQQLQTLAGEDVDTIDREQVSLASIRSGIAIEDNADTGASDGDEESASDADIDLDELDGDIDEEQMEARLEDDGDDEAQDQGPSIEELSPEEREELKDELMAEKTERALATWSSVENIYDDEHDRYEQKRVFDLPQMQNLEARLYGGESEEFRDLFPYIDWEEGLVDVSVTDPDHIPSWYEANDKEVVNPGHEQWEYVRETPSPTNALGLVKIIFPNYDNIYLHDTPEKSLFHSAVRGFSHGCIRLEEPLELAEKLLELDGQLDEVNIDRILRDEDYHPVFLNRHVPIYLEYYTVRIDDEGRANFLADIYDYDDQALAGEPDPALHQEVNIHPDERDN